VDVFPIPEGAEYSYQEGWTSAHHGTDIFASRGQAVVAVSPGRARAAIDPKGGKVVYLTADDGWRYYYAHLDAWNPELEAAGSLGVDVDAGSFLGQVGNTGNAAETSPHVHFQAAPPGGDAVDPFPLLVDVDPKFAPLPDLGVQTPIPPPPADVAPPAKPPGGAPEAGAGVLLALLAWAWMKRHRRSRR
jgi:hypothetical protein